MADMVAPLPINTRMTVTSPTTVGAARQPPAPLGSIRLTSPASGGSGANGAPLRWADITPGQQVSLSSSAFGSGAFGSGVYGSGAYRQPTSRSDAPSMLFPPTPSPWASMKTYQFGSLRQAPVSPSSMTPATEVSSASGSVAIPATKTSSPGGVSLSPGTATSNGSPVLPQTVPYPAGQQQQVVVMQMPMQTVQPMHMTVQQPSAAPMMMMPQGSVGMPYVVQQGASVMQPTMVPTSEMAEAMDPLQAQAQAAHQAAMMQSGAFPSVGSALHVTGKCSPCAWFWKKTGCQNAQNCAYCHLCPEGELKNRKKAKVAAIRMGALQPATVIQSGTSSVTAQPAKLRLSTLVSDS